MKKSKRIVSLILAFVMTIGIIPNFGITAGAEPAAIADFTTVSDGDTTDDWKYLFPLKAGELNTENAGGVWTDKTVFTKDKAIQKYGEIAETQVGDNNFLAVLSTIASNMEIKDRVATPTDTMIILDLSSSMYNNGSLEPGKVNTMVSAVNDSIKKIYAINEQNRVGVTIYYGHDTVIEQSFGNHGKLMLPLGRHKSSDGKYLSTTVSGGDLKSIQVSDTVTINSRAKHKIPDIAGTYAQLGIWHAMEEFLKADTITDDGIARLPIFVFMSDGEPTAATENFAVRYDTSTYTHGYPNATMGNNQVTTRQDAQSDFVTMLTASWAKEMVDVHYEKTTPLFYTLSLGNSISLDVMDPTGQNKSVPAQNSDTAKINGYWQTLVDTGSVSFDTKEFRGTWTCNKTRSHTVNSATVNGQKFPSSMTQRFYVDKTFTSPGTENIDDAFVEIVAAITEKSQYYPTLVEGTAEHSGYVSFVDRIGDYMHVESIKGISIADRQIYDGEIFAQKLFSGQFGTVQNPTALGDNFVWSVQERLGMKTTAEVRALISLAANAGQLAYDSATGKYSNIIGWYADANGKYIDFWDGKVSSRAAAPANAKYRVNSYVYMGTVKATQVDSDLMYATVRIMEDIDTGEQTVAFGVPADLLPTVTYQVEVKGKGDNQKVQSIKVEGAPDNTPTPIRLFYEISLNDDITAYNVKDKVSGEYVAQAGSVNNDDVYFYTNKFDRTVTDGEFKTTGYSEVNTYSYFYPSAQNDRFYFQNDSRIYTDEDCTVLYKGSNPEAENIPLYRKHVIYVDDKVNYPSGIHIRGALLSNDALVAANPVVAGDTGNGWVVPAGTIRHQYKNLNVNEELFELKDKEGNINNNTQSLIYSHNQFIDTQAQGENGYVVGATLGNNGRITITAVNAALELTKTVEGTFPDGKEFTFNIDSAGVSGSFTAKSSLGADKTVTFTDGKASVNLKAGETVTITDIPAGNYTVTEPIGNSYVIKTVNGQSGTNTATVEMKPGEVGRVNITNVPRGEGRLTIAKVIEYPTGTLTDNHKAKEFTIKGKLVLNGAPLAEKEYFMVVNGVVSADKVTTGADGVFTVTLKHNEQIELAGLPEGTVATVTEVLEEPKDHGYTASYYENGTPAQSASQGVVTVLKDRVVSVIVKNTFAPDEVHPVNVTISVNKEVSGRDNDEWIADDAYTFVLEKRNAANTGWETISVEKTISAKGSTVDFNEVFGENLSYTEEGVYYYRIKEIVGSVPGVNYDARYHSFGVYVADENNDGKLEITKVTPRLNSGEDETNEALHATVVKETTVEGAKHYQVTTNFDNVYAPSNAEAIINVNKKVNNHSLTPNLDLSGFEFVISQIVDEGTNEVARETTGVSGVAKFDVTGLTLGEDETEKTYRYVIKEVIPADGDGKPGWTYIPAEIYVNVKVTKDNSAVLKAETYLADENGNAVGEPNTSATLSVEHSNEYKAQMAQAQITIEKQLTGRTLRDGDATFKLVPVGDNYKLIDNNGDEISGNEIKVSNTGANTNITLYFDKVGTYYHEVTEIDAASGITIDNNTYRVTVEVKDNGGQLEANAYVVNIGGDTMVFRNSYIPEPTDFEIKANKELTGKPLVNNFFTFYLQECDQNGTVNPDATVYTVTNNADGSISFPAVKFTDHNPDSANADDKFEYRFLVWEKQPEQATSEPEQQNLNGEKQKDTSNIEYDNRAFIVTIPVYDDGNGAMKVDTDGITYKVKGGEAAAGVAFVNDYKPSPAEYQIVAKKYMNGKKLEADKFTFELYTSNNAWEEVALLESQLLEESEITDKHNGEVAFTKFEYKFDKSVTPEINDVGEYYYIVKEVKGSEKGIIYDETVFGVKITVSDNQRGNILATAEIFDLTDGSRADEIKFNNKVPGVKPTPKPDKTPVPTPIPSTTPDPNNPNTSDPFNMNLIYGIMAISACAIGALIFFGKKRKEEEEPETNE